MPRLGYPAGMTHAKGRSVNLSAAVCGVLVALLLGSIGGWAAGIGQRMYAEDDRVNAEFGPASLFSDGQWAVGTEVEEGVYLQDPKAKSDCEVSSEQTGAVELAADQPADGRMAIRLSRGDVVSSKACGIWRKR